MDKYEVISLLGEGSFGRVYKAKQTSDTKFVALKVISKRGRSVKELKGLRRECEIQRYLHHPNIIQMLDSFETENEIVVITEFAHKELNVILGKEGYLPEERVQAIVWDLVSALYYLHSHRVLHRDLKPQNILLDTNNCAKLCDFGFARNMSTGTHVLTSIKGTPLYMAPELIEEQPYDHNADLWSLGCIIYELLVGAPPFCTASILHLIRLIRHEQIQWPTFITEDCISFLKGLLQKNPSKRLTWPEILSHPFVKGHILICEDLSSMPLTRAMSANTLQAKEQQKKDHFIQKTAAQNKSTYSKNPEGNQTNEASKLHNLKTSKTSINSNTTASNEANKKSDVKEKRCSQNVNEKLEKLSLESKSKDEKKSSTQSGDKVNNTLCDNTDVKNSSFIRKVPEAPNDSVSAAALENSEAKSIRNIEEILQTKLSKINIHEDSHPIENEEWIVFLHRTIEEVMSGEMTSLLQPNLTNIIVSPLRNVNANPKVVGYVANLLALPFVVRGISEDTLDQIKKVYLEVKLIPNLVYGSKLLTKEKRTNISNNSTPTPTNTPTLPPVETYKPLNDLAEDDLQALEHIYVLICYLVHTDLHFLHQFCDAVLVLNIYILLQKLLALSKKRIRIVTDLVAVLNQVLRKTPENFELIDRVILNSDSNPVVDEECLNFVHLLRHTNCLLRERVCVFLTYLAKCSKKTLENLWSDKMKETLEALVYDSMENVRNAAEISVEEIRTLDFYTNSVNSDMLYSTKSN